MLIVVIDVKRLIIDQRFTRDTCHLFIYKIGCNTKDVVQGKIVEVLIGVRDTIAEKVQMRPLFNTVRDTDIAANAIVIMKWIFAEGPQGEVGV